jgi:hypothetical protein
MVELANKKFTSLSGAPSAIQFKRSEDCMYAGLKTALHINIVTKSNYSITAGAGVFGSAALKGFSSEKNTDPSAVPYGPKSKIKIGNTSGYDYKKLDAGITLQMAAGYKNIKLITMYDVSVLNNKPKYIYYTDPMGMPTVISSFSRKWRSLFAGLGYSFSLNCKKKFPKK